ncbi:MAG: hypothetical protein HXK50_00740 [Atopobium sp.]|nr:hypothetical protein [Atopobium sp.]
MAAQQFTNSNLETNFDSRYVFGQITSNISCDLYLHSICSARQVTITQYFEKLEMVYISAGQEFAKKKAI